MGSRLLIVLGFLAVLTCATVLPAAPALAAPWLDVDKFSISMPAANGRDSFVLQGSFSMPAWEEITAEEVTLTIDSTWSVLFPAEAWKRVSARTFTAKQSGVSARMTYCIGGSSRCLFRFTAARQSLKGVFADMSQLPIRLQVAPSFDESVTAIMNVHRRSAKRASLGPRPLFHVDRFTAWRARPADGDGGEYDEFIKAYDDGDGEDDTPPSRDRLLFTGKLLLDTPFDPLNDSISIEIPGVYADVPAGSFTVLDSGKLLQYRTTTEEGGRILVRLNTRTGKLTISATRLNLSEMSPMDAFFWVSISGQVDAEWQLDAILSENRAHTLLKY